MCGSATAAARRGGRPAAGGRRPGRWGGGDAAAAFLIRLRVRSLTQSRAHPVVSILVLGRVREPLKPRETPPATHGLAPARPRPDLRPPRPHHLLLPQPVRIASCCAACLPSWRRSIRGSPRFGGLIDWFFGWLIWSSRRRWRGSG
ncbi:hypothetical protein BS78_02G047500 [Paspalum vaginatum]|nr:hypothetical protein BS78_02G047500 [Paspalum vaginatum]